MLLGNMVRCRAILKPIVSFFYLVTTLLGRVFLVIGWISILPIVLFYGLIGILVNPWSEDCNKLISIISRTSSLDGKFIGVVLDCWPQAGFGLQTETQGLIVYLVRPEQEKTLTSSVESCDTPRSAMLSVWKENLKDRPLLHWASATNLVVMVPDDSEITLFKTNLEGITVNFVREKTDEQKQRRINETSNEPKDFEKQYDNYTWVKK